MLRSIRDLARSRQPSRRAGASRYALACVRVAAALREGDTLADDVLDALIDGHGADADRKRLISGLLGARLVTRDQAAMQVYLRPALRDA